MYRKEPVPKARTLPNLTTQNLYHPGASHERGRITLGEETQSPDSYTSPWPPTESRQRTDLIKHGTYRIKNDLLDFYLGMDSGCLVSKEYEEDDDDLKWRFSPLGEGWTIQHVPTGLFLNLSGVKVDREVQIIENRYPAAWDVQVKRGPSISRQTVYWISWPRSGFAWDLPVNPSLSDEPTVIKIAPGTRVIFTTESPRDLPDRGLWQLIPTSAELRVVDNHNGSESDDSCTITEETIIVTKVRKRNNSRVRGSNR